MRQLFREGLLLIIGTFFYVLSTLLITPVEIVPGSVLGIAVIAYALSGISIGTVTLLCNIPIMLLCAKCFGKKILIYTVIIIVGTSVLIDLFLPVFPAILVRYGFVLAVIGGGMMGFGAGLLMRAGGTMGGTTAVGRLLQRKYPGMDMGNVLFVMDTSIILAGAFLLQSFSSLAYSLVYTLVCCKVIGWICDYKAKVKGEGTENETSV